MPEFHDSIYQAYRKGKDYPGHLVYNSLWSKAPEGRIIVTLNRLYVESFLSEKEFLEYYKWI